MGAGCRSAVVEAVTVLVVSDGGMSSRPTWRIVQAGTKGNATETLYMCGPPTPACASAAAGHRRST